MRVDYDGRRLCCSVNDLIYEATYRRIGVERGDGFRRMWIGQEIHTRRAEERAGDDPFYRAEVVVSHRIERGGWEVTISGRVDGLSIDRERKTIVLEEVKSIHFELELYSLKRSEKLQRYLFQLMLYAHFIAQQEEYAGFAFQPQLVVIDLVTGRAEVIDAPYQSDDVASALDGSIDKLIDDLESERALQIAKRAFADGLPFPHETMRPFQREMVDAVARAVREKEALLVSAPTGVGKTIAAIYPALREALRAGKKLFYLTPKTLQQEMAVATLKLLNDGSFRVLRIRAKQKMCAHTEMICHEDYCPWAARYTDKMERNNLRSRIVDSMSYFDPDVTFEMAKSEEVCPFEVSLELIDEADVIVCDYNYIFDPYVGLKTYQQENDYGDCVLVVDEAHNLVDRGRGYYSPELHEKSFETIALHLAARPGCPLEGWEDLVAELRAHFQELAGGVLVIPSEARDPLQDAADFPKEIPRFARDQALCEPDLRLFQRQRAAWEELIIRYIAWKIQYRLAEENDPLVDFYFKLVKFTNLLGEEGDELARIIERTRDGLKLKIFCKDPSRFLGRILDSAHATVAISATLEPFDFYRKTLGFPESRTFELSLPSPFPRENRKIVVIPEIDTTYRERSTHYVRIGELVAQLAESNAGNFLALFPSYAFLDEVSMRMPPLRKDVLVQRSDMTDWERRSFLDRLRQRGGDGNLILAVSGGMYAEGIDYQGEMLSGVFVVGPALPAVSFEQELLKRYYDEQYGAGFEYAYLIPGMTRVIQSAGRVIRSERDIGVIALLCKRFTKESYTRFFPPDWYELSPRELVSKRPADEIRHFFESRRSPQLRLM